MATIGSTSPVVTETEMAADTMGRKAPRIEPNANSRMNRATPTPMLSEEGGSPWTKPKIPFAPTVMPSWPFCALITFRAEATCSVGRSLNEAPANFTVA